LERHVGAQATTAANRGTKRGHRPDRIPGLGRVRPHGFRCRRALGADRTGQPWGKRAKRPGAGNGDGHGGNERHHPGGGEKCRRNRRECGYRPGKGQGGRQARGQGGGSRGGCARNLGQAQRQHGRARAAGAGHRDRAQRHFGYRRPDESFGAQCGH